MRSLPGRLLGVTVTALRPALALLALVAVTSTSCGNDAKIIGIDVMVDDVELVVGLSTQATAVVTWVDGRSGEPADIEWKSTDTSVATVDGNGLVTKLSLKQLRKLDAGSWKNARYQGERVPTLTEALTLLKGTEVIEYNQLMLMI